QPEDFSRPAVERDVANGENPATLIIKKGFAQPFNVYHAVARMYVGPLRQARSSSIRGTPAHEARGPCDGNDLIRSSAGCLGKLGLGDDVDVLVEYVTLPWNVAGLANGPLDLVKRQMMHGARRGDDVLLDHQASHVVGTEVQAKLADLGALGHPRRLDVRHVVEVEPRDRLGLEVLEGPRRGHAGHVGVIGLKHPGDEGREAPSLILKLANPLEVLDPVCHGLDMTEHHGRGRSTAQLMPDLVNLQPVVGQHLAPRDRLADAIDQDLGATTGKASQPRLFETPEHRPERQFRDLREVVNLRGAEAVDVDPGKMILDIAEQLLVPLQSQMRMQSALHEDLVSAQRHGLADLLEHDVAVEHVGIGIVHLAVKSAEIADCGADVGVVDVAVDVVRAVRLGMKPLADSLGRAAKVQEARLLKQRDAFLEGQAAAANGALQDRGDGGRQGSLLPGPARGGRPSGQTASTRPAPAHQARTTELASSNRSTWRSRVLAGVHGPWQVHRHGPVQGRDCELGRGADRQDRRLFWSPRARTRKASRSSPARLPPGRPPGKMNHAAPSSRGRRSRAPRRPYSRAPTLPAAVT